MAGDPPKPNRRQRRAGSSTERRRLREGLKKLDREPKVRRVRLTGEFLRKIPVRECVLFVTLGRLSNELAMLSKFGRWCSQHCNGEAFDDPARLAQGFEMLLMLVGKLFEGWEFLRAAYFSGSLSKEYDPILDSETRDSLKELRRYFSKDNKLKSARNRFVFHFDIEATEGALRDVPGGEEFEILFGHHHPNSFYQVSQAVLVQALARDLDGKDPRRGLDDLMEEASMVTGQFLKFIDGLIHTLLDRNLGRECAAETVDITDVAVESSKVEIPYFVKNPRR